MVQRASAQTKTVTRYIFILFIAYHIYTQSVNVFIKIPSSFVMNIYPSNAPLSLPGDLPVLLRSHIAPRLPAGNHNLSGCRLHRIHIHNHLIV